MHLRIKEKLRNGELTVAGDQWPVFLYHGYNYNQDDPWNGLFRSSVLVTVGHIQIWRGVVDIQVRHTSTYSHPLVPSIMSPKLLGPATHGSTE